MTGNDTGFLVITGSVSSQLENLSSKVLENSSKINRSSSTNTKRKRSQFRLFVLKEKKGMVKTNR